MKSVGKCRTSMPKERFIRRIYDGSSGDWCAVLDRTVIVEV